ncbi:alanine racemase [Virgibacillus sp. MSP4-1]|uniref:alanine racemase n=1 Tax=Virgibacillus sp. MSP4-1 TaxID=2700081 RepID=UPI0003A85C48|nr:alanine racemase [Virgibacillus sp. MSP4-1]QHS24114.1 alanine racemase [Virgibacillus sp. MSP4-1]
MSLQPFYRDSWCEVNLDAIQYNIRQLKHVLAEDTKIFAVVKGNAYGHGDIQVANAALEEGVFGLAVTLLDEALKLRQAGIEAPILVMSWVRPEDVRLAADHDIAVTVFQKEWVEQARDHLHGRTLSVHVKIDTGMGRVGIRTEEEMKELVHVLHDSRFQITGAFTHFATADEEDEFYYQKQQLRFSACIDMLKSSVKDDSMVVHSGNSAASMRYPEDMFDGVRFGISMYGLYPSPYVKQIKPIDLQPAFSLHSKLIHVKKVPAGEGISYGKTYQTEEEEWIGTVPIGYADGWIRKLNKQYVIINGKKMPIVGRICMDQFMVKLDGPYEVGEKVTLIGKQEEEEVTIDEVAETLETINYEIPCTISYRVPRVYFHNQKLTDVDNKLYSEKICLK